MKIRLKLIEILVIFLGVVAAFWIGYQQLSINRQLTDANYRPLLEVANENNKLALHNRGESTISLEFYRVEPTNKPLLFTSYQRSIFPGDSAVLDIKDGLSSYIDPQQPNNFSILEIFFAVKNPSGYKFFQGLIPISYEYGQKGISEILYSSGRGEITTLELGINNFAGLLSGGQNNEDRNGVSGLLGFFRSITAHTEDIFYNILGGIFASLLTLGVIKTYAFLNGRRFRNIFGFVSDTPFFITYGLLKLDQVFDVEGRPYKFPFIKPDVTETFGNLSALVSDAQTRGVNYVAEAFGKNANIKASLVSDTEIMNKLDISFCSVGGRNNLKTRFVEEHEENKFFKFDLADGGSIVAVKDTTLRFSVYGTFDYGFIIKLRPSSLSNRTWIAIAGLGEWGTSGAAWFLTRNWKQIEKMYGDKQFGLVIKVKGGKDESAEMVYHS